MSTPHLFKNVGALVQPWSDPKDALAPVDVTPDAALLVRDGVLLAAGAAPDVMGHEEADRAEHHDLGGRAVVPGFVDSHTHTVHAAERIDEMARRARGESYEEIAAAGGGILSSMRALHEMSAGALADAAALWLQRMLARGTTTCEIKSGYGLTEPEERKSLRAIASLTERGPQRVFATLLAHTVPPEARSDREGYLKQWCEGLIPDVAANNEARFFDIFVESIAFDADEAEALAQAAQAAGLGLKLHVDQLGDSGGAALAARFGALSADHLEYVSAAGAQALAQAGVVATILPGCALFLGKGPWPPGRMLRDAGCAVAVATDFNPGSCHIYDLSMCGSMAATRCGLSFEEALWGITRGGAAALGLHDRGTLRGGELADFVVLDHTDWRALFYTPGDPPIHAVYIGGKVAFVDG